MFSKKNLRNKNRNTDVILCLIFHSSRILIQLNIFDVSLFTCTIANKNLMPDSVNTRSHPREPKRRLKSSESHPQNSKQLDSRKDKSTRTRSTNKQDLSTSYTQRGYEPGMALIAEDELERAGLACQQLHKWYMDQTDGKKTISPVALGLEYLETHLLNGVAYILLTYEDLFDFFTLFAIDVGLLTCFSL